MIMRSLHKIQNPSEPQNTPRNTPQIPLQNRKYRKITKNIRKQGDFVYFLYFFCILVLEGDLGCISGGIFGCRGVVYFVWGAYDRKVGFKNVISRFSWFPWFVVPRNTEIYRSGKEKHMSNSIFMRSRQTQRAQRSKKIRSPSKFSISIEMFNLAREFQSRRFEFPTKNRAAVGGSLENFILA